jgi:RNA-directed DNA polymerase
MPGSMWRELETEPGTCPWSLGWGNRSGNRRKHEGPRTYRQEKPPRQFPTLLTLRRYRNGKLLIKPSTTAIKEFRKRLAREFRTLRGANTAAVLARIVPIVRGWVAYYRTVVSSKVFAALGNYLWKLTYKWACWTHSNKPKRWIVQRYYGKFDKFRADRWVFGDRDTGAYLPNPAWTDIVRHTLVKGRASVDDPDLTRYWAQRRGKVRPPLDSYTTRLLSRQDRRCTLCGDDLLTVEDPPADHLVHHDQPGMSRDRRTHLVHAHCSQKSILSGRSRHRAVAAEARTALAACLGRMRGNALVRS